MSEDPKVKVMHQNRVKQQLWYGMGKIVDYARKYNHNHLGLSSKTT